MCFVVLGFFLIFFPPEEAQSSYQHTRGFPFAVATFLRSTGRTPCLAQGSRVRRQTSFPMPTARTTTVLAGQALDSGKHCFQRNTNIPICPKLQLHGISYFTDTDWTLGIHCHPENDFITSSNSDSIHFHLKNLLFFFFNIVHYGISTWHWNQIYSNREAVKPNKNLSYFKLHYYTAYWA